jgi:hypothetical protein
MQGGFDVQKTTHSLSYDGQALRDREPYLVIVHYDNGVTHVIPQATLTEAISLAPSQTFIVELAKVEELVEGEPVRRSLGMNVFGVWIISGNQKELTMARVKQNGTRDVANDLLGVSKPRRGAKVEAAQTRTTGRGAVVKKASAEPRTPRLLFEDRQRLKKVGDRNTRPDSNVGKAISLIRPNMTFGEFAKAMEKTKNPLKPSGILGFLVKEGVVEVR